MRLNPADYDEDPLNAISTDLKGIKFSLYVLVGVVLLGLFLWLYMLCRPIGCIERLYWLD